MPDIETDETCSECGQKLYIRPAISAKGSNFDYSEDPRFRRKWMCHTTDPRCQRPIRPA